MMLAVLSVLMCAGAAAGAAGRGAATLASPALFAVETTVLVNDVARNDRELGYRLKARLAVRPLHRDRDTLLLEFRLIAPALLLRGKHRNAEYLPRPSLWDDLGEASFFAHWEAGTVRTAYLDPREPLDVLNYKRSIISLFQFNSEDGDYKETDISGDCDVLYETISETVFRKTKEACACDAAPATLRRVSRYTLAAAGGPLAAVHAEELATVGDAALGLKARAWHALAALTPPAAAAAPQAPSLDAALAALPAPLAPAALPLAAPPAPAADADAQDFDDHLVAARGEGAGEGEGAAGAGGDAATAEAALRLAAALRRAPEWGAGEWGEGRARALGASGTRAALAAADAVVQLRARDAPPALAAAYLEAFALGGAPEAAAVAEVLRVGEEAASAAVRASALLAAAAAAATRAAAGDAAASAAVRDSLLRSLARCKEEECAAVRLRALANLRRADTVEALLEHARRGAAAPVAALAALDALAAAPARALAPHLGRVGAVALDARAPLEVRAAALQLALAGWARVPLAHPIARMAAALLDDEHEHELRRLFWQRLRAIAARSAAVRELLPRLHVRLRGWHALALNGTSSVLQRDVGWQAAGWRAALDSAQLARGGLLRRGEVRLFATDARGRGRDADLLSVEMWTRGMEALAGGEGVDGAPPAAGLAFSVRGVRMRGVTLFDGQAELLGHVWSGTGSAPTPALRATLPLEERRATLPLAAGVALRVAWRAGAAVAVDAHAQVSLWWRTARAALELRAALVAHAHARLATAWGEVRASARSALEPRLHIGADADFYDAVALCVRVRNAEHRGARNATLRSELGARRMRVARERRASVTWPGRTLALGAPNDAACRTLRAADAPDAPDAPHAPDAPDAPHAPDAPDA